MVDYSTLSKEELMDHHIELMKSLNKIRNRECTDRMKNGKMKLSSEVNKYVATTV